MCKTAIPELAGIGNKMEKMREETSTDARKHIEKNIP